MPELKNKIEVDEVELVLPVSTATTNVVKDVVKERTDRQQVIIGLIKENPSLSGKQNMTTRSMSFVVTVERKNVEDNVEVEVDVELTIPDKPNSKNQKYRKVRKEKMRQLHR